MTTPLPLPLHLQLRFFASLRESLGAAEELTLNQPTTVGGVRALLVARGGAYARMLGDGRAVRAALNQVLCSADTPIVASAELAFFPPVTGG